MGLWVVFFGKGGRLGGEAIGLSIGGVFLGWRIGAEFDYAFLG